MKPKFYLKLYLITYISLFVYWCGHIIGCLSNEAANSMLRFSETCRQASNGVKMEIEVVFHSYFYNSHEEEHVLLFQY